MTGFLQIQDNMMFLKDLVKRSFLLSLLVIASFCHAQVVINEVHVQPQPDSTDIQTQALLYCTDTSYGAEWIEIYNSSQCDTIDLSCYMLGSRMADTNYGTFAFPANSRLFPLSFAVIGGKRAPNVDYVLPDYCASNNICGIGEWFLSNTYGWVALYKPDGTVADAVFWTPGGGQAGQLTSNPAFGTAPCVPSGCTAATSLDAASDMNPGTEILYAGRAPGFGLSLYRQLDGGVPWLTGGVPSAGQCNGPCAQPTDLTIQITDFENETCLEGNGWVKAVVTGGTEPYDLDWTGALNGDSIFDLDAGVYVVTVTDAANCEKSASVTLVNQGVPVTASITPQQSVIFKGESVQLDLVTVAIIDSIFWSPATGLSCGNCPSPVASPAIVTNYSVLVKDTDGCEGTATATVDVISDENSTFIPTAFTPNGDNWNDLLFVRSPKLTGLEFHIYDRWGNEVFTTNDASVGWDGKNKNGKDVDVGIYVYYAVVTFDNGKSKTLKGNVGVIR